MVPDGAGLYLFLETPFGGPLEELYAIFDRKRCLLESHGEVVAALELESAYREARRALEAALASPACAAHGSSPASPPEAAPASSVTPGPPQAPCQRAQEAGE